MQDINFSNETREVIIANGDFDLCDDASIQNGAILEFSKGAILQNPTLGIGIELFINNDSSQVNYEMNRWAKQVTNDGGKGNFQITNDGLDYTINTQVKY